MSPQFVSDAIDAGIMRGTTVQSLFAETLNDLFAKYDHPEIA